MDSPIIARYPIEGKREATRLVSIEVIDEGKQSIGDGEDFKGHVYRTRVDINDGKTLWSVTNAVGAEIENFWSSMAERFRSLSLISEIRRSDIPEPLKEIAIERIYKKFGLEDYRDSEQKPADYPGDQ